MKNNEIPVIAPTPNRRFIAANILDPVTGDVQFHIVSTKWFNILAVTFVTLVLCGLTVLGLVLYLKWSVEQNTEDIKTLQKQEEVK